MVRRRAKDGDWVWCDDIDDGVADRPVGLGILPSPAAAKLGPLDNGLAGLTTGGRLLR